ncbi:MAG: hypothetical protein Q8P54_01290 [bacterium]|nr:hypothetical protein [bacterium]
MKSSITQEHDFGCAIACMAFITNKSYQDLLMVLGNNKAATRGIYCKELVEILGKLGYFYSYNYLKPKLKVKIYQDSVIVFIQRSKKYPTGHYLVRYKNLWMDPWINLQTSSDIKKAKSGFRKRLPGRPIYGVFPEV